MKDSALVIMLTMTSCLMISVPTENERTVTGMAEYIELETAIETIMSEPTDAHYPSWYADKIKEIPAADVAQVRHGQWDFSGKCRFQKDNSVAVRCTECGCCLTEPEYRRYIWNYCPVCGAKMDLEVADGKAD